MDGREMRERERDGERKSRKEIKEWVIHSSVLVKERLDCGLF